MKLVIEDAAGTRSTVTFTGDEIVVGRAAEGITCRLEDRDVSRRHARFLRASGAVYVEDLGSLTGTRVNGLRITGRRKLREGDLVEIGAYDLAVLPDAAVPDAPPPLPPGATPPPPRTLIVPPGLAGAPGRAEPARPASLPVAPPVAGPLRAEPKVREAAPIPAAPAPAPDRPAHAAALPAPGGHRQRILAVGAAGLLLGLLLGFVVAALTR